MTNLTLWVSKEKSDEALENLEYVCSNTMLGQGYGTSQHPNNSEMTISMKNLKITRRKNCLSVTSSQVMLNYLQLKSRYVMTWAMTWAVLDVYESDIIIILFLALQSLVNLSLIQNCPPSFSAPQIAFRFSHAHLLQILLDWLKRPQFRFPKHVNCFLVKRIRYQESL